MYAAHPNNSLYQHFPENLNAYQKYIQSRPTALYPIQPPQQITNLTNDEQLQFSTYIPTNPLSPTWYHPTQSFTQRQEDTVTDEEDDESDGQPSHPNKYAVQIEYHNSQQCSYRRQNKRSGDKMKQKMVTSYHPVTLELQTSVEQVKYYLKHIGRVCRCGNYESMDGPLQQGRNNDCPGYEIHYNQKCKWKAFDDFYTGKRVLIRLCKCYKPAK